ncbi:MAG: Cys-tRNA(Pro) deacylase [Myxococcota bacterium]
MGKDRHPVTPAIRVLRHAGVAFVPRLYDYVERGGTAHSSAELGVDEHRVIKTIVCETETKAPLVVLMHGDRKVSTKALARVMGVKTVRPCEPDVAGKHTGYVVGGTSPFGTRRPLPVYMQQSITALPKVVINGGKRGFLVEIAPQDIVAVLAPTLVDVATE